jgi:hypothetical protein
MLARAVVGKTERTYQSDENYPRRKHERGENSRNKGRWSLLLWTESVFDSRLRMIMDFFWVWNHGL